MTITTRRLADGTVEISPRGEIDVRTATDLSTAIATALNTSVPRQIRVDLWQVTMIDSVAIGALVTAHRDAAAKGVRLVVANPNATVHRQLLVSGLLAMFGSPPRPR